MNRNTEQAGPSEGSLPAVEEKIRAFLSEEAPAIVAQAEENPLVVVTGPMRSGKTKSLIPAIERGLQAQGHEVAQFDGQMTTFLPKEEWAEILPASQSRTGVLIVDEAGALFSEQKEKDFIDFAHDRGYTKVIAVAAYPIDDTQAPQKLEARWRDAAGLPDAPAIHIPPKLLSAPLAREYVTARGLFRSTPPDAIEYVLSTVPYNIYALSTVSGERTLEWTIDAIRANADMWQGAVPQAEIARVKQRVGHAR